MDIVALFCDIDDFCLRFEPHWHPRLLTQGAHPRQREATLTLSEVMTIEVAFHESGYRTFKDFSLRSVTPYLRWAFPRLQLQSVRRMDADMSDDRDMHVCCTDRIVFR
jgi:hypothetical protein